MSKPLLPLCALPKAANRDGYTSQHLMLLPFYQYGYWAPDGKQYAFSESAVPQNRNTLLGGLHQPLDTFQKSCCSAGAY